MKTSLFEYQPRLELATLARHGFVREGQDSVVLLQWGGHLNILDMVACEISLSNPAFPHVVIASISNSRLVIDQLIRLSAPDNSPRRRRAFLCPCTGRKVETLAFRDGRWASMAAQNLRYESQRSERYARHVSLGYRDLEAHRPGLS